jgi:hypothetical protein
MDTNARFYLDVPHEVPGIFRTHDYRYRTVRLRIRITLMPFH